MGKSRLGIVVGILLLLFVSCNSPGPTLTATTNDYRVEITFAQIPTINQSVATTLRFYYQDSPIAVQNVVCDLQMPGMIMGSMRPIADSLPNGDQVVNLLFTMDGEWSIIVTADTDNGPIRLFVEGITIAPDSQATQSPAQE